MSSKSRSAAFEQIDVQLVVPQPPKWAVNGMFVCFLHFVLQWLNSQGYCFSGMHLSCVSERCCQSFELVKKIKTIEYISSSTLERGWTCVNISDMFHCSLFSNLEIKATLFKKWLLLTSRQFCAWSKDA